MKRNLLIIGVAIFLLCTSLFITLFYNKSYEECVKPYNVPDAAVWIGGCDGGVWIELVEVKHDTVRLRIYRDSNGELVLDSNFHSSTCQNTQVTKMNWNKIITSYDGESLNINGTNAAGGIGCQLEPITPAYYDERELTEKL